MVKISDEIKNFLKQQKLGFVATVSKENTPNLSPRGTIIAWDDDHLVFAHIKSPQTMLNIETNPFVEINVIDPLKRRGYRFSGKATVMKDGEKFNQIVSQYESLGIQSKILAVALVDVESVSEITSPLYDLGYTEQEIQEKWKKYYLSF